MNILKVFMSIISLLFSLFAFANEVSGTVDCVDVGKGPYYFECRLLIGIKDLQEVATFKAESSGYLSNEGALRENLSVFQFISIDESPRANDGWRFWVYNSKERKIVFSSIVDLPIHVIDVDGERGNEILVRSKLADYPAGDPMLIAFRYVPHLVAYSILEDGMVEVLDPLRYGAFSKQWGEELDRLEKYFEKKRKGLIKLSFDDETFSMIDEYISLQLILIESQRDMLCSYDHGARYLCLK